MVEGEIRKHRRGGRVHDGRHPRGRQLEDAALAEVRALLGERPRRRDLLIEHLHLIQDRYGHLSAAHLAALAHEMRLAQTEVYENLVQAGVIDPTKVVRTALQDAASVAGLLITTEATIADVPEDKPAAPMGGMGGMGGMDF